MGDFFYLFLFSLLIVAIFLNEDFVLVILYLFVGALVIGKYWGKRSLTGVSVQRDFSQRVFHGEKVSVNLTIRNHSWLPIPWLHIRENLPIEIIQGERFQTITFIAPKSHSKYQYNLDCRKRGYYSLGPMVLSSGDVLGVAGIQTFSVPEQHLTVFPKIIPLTHVKIPSSSPMGTLRHNQPIFEDPSRAFGKRNYITGDSIRRVDWKATANTGQLLVRLFEPSIALDASILLNLNLIDYDIFTRFDVPELAIIVAASLANWIIGKKQSVGLATNGIDPIIDGGPPASISPHSGRGHLLRLLEVLARIQVAETISLVDLLKREIYNLAWGTTLIIVTNRIDDELFDGLFLARRSGINSMLIQCGISKSIESVKKRAKFFNFPLYQVVSEQDLDIWKR